MSDDHLCLAGRIHSGALPWTLEDTAEELMPKYRAGHLTDTWEGWCRMWFGITYVRYQGFERDWDSSEMP